MESKAFYKKGIWGVYVGIMTLVFCFFAIHSPVQGKDLTIGYLSGISGAQAHICNLNRFGTEQAVEYVNKNQLLGKDISLKLLVADSQINVTVALNAYQGFKDKVLTFIAYDTSGASGLRPFVEQDRKPFVALTTNGTFVYPPSKYLFGFAPPYEELLVGFMKAVKSSWKEKRPPKIGLISFETPSGRVANSAAQKYGPEIGWDVNPVSIVALTTVDFSEAIARIKAEKPDWVLLSLTGGQIKNVLEQAGTAGIKNSTRWLLPMWGGFNESMTEVIPMEALNGVYGFCMASHPDVHAGAKKWGEWTKSNAGKISDEAGNSGAAGVFIVMRAIQLALEKVPIEKLDGEKLSENGYQRIKNFQMFGDLMPPVTFSPTVTRGSTKATILRMENQRVKEAIAWFDVPSLGGSK
jgi:ABC-type branched-subunit amino acid transport system substrate-binding protein